MKYLATSLFSICLLFLASCTKDSDITLDRFTENPTPDRLLYSTFSGVVLDLNDEIIPDAVINIGDETTRTNELGLFELNGYFNAEGSKLRIQKEGYFISYGYLLPIVDTKSQLKLYLRDRITDNTFNTGDTNTFNGDNYSVKFKEDAFIDENNSAYNGEFGLYTSYSSPSSEDIAQFFPGTFVNQDGEETSSAIISYGVIQVELEGSNAEDLNISQPAQLFIGIPSEFINTAPKELSLFSLNEDTGVWIKEGTAQLEGDQYVGEVNHFSIWTVGEEFEFVGITGTVERSGMAYANAVIKVNDGINQREFRTADNGLFNFGLYAGQDIMLMIENSCGAIIHEENISVGYNDITTTITIDEAIEYYTISGQLTCGSNAIDGTIFIFGDENSIPFTVRSEQGQYTFQIERCESSSIRFYGLDSASGTISEIVTASDDATVNLNLCEQEINSSLILKIFADGSDPMDSNRPVVETIDFSDAVMVTRTEMVKGEMHTVYKLSATHKDYTTNDSGDNVSANYQYEWSVSPSGNVEFGSGGFSPNTITDLPFWYDISLFTIDSSVEIIDDKYISELIVGVTKEYEDGTSDFLQSGQLNLDVQVK